jgi:chemotaxis protein CheD
MDMLMKTNTIMVKIADMAVLKKTGTLVTVGLGSCVGIALYDPLNKVGGLAHILLSNSQDFRNNNSFSHAKFADTAIPMLINEMERLGGKKNRLLAKIAGGSSLFSFQKTKFSIGENNIFMVKRVLQTMSLPLKGEDVGGVHGRTMRFFVETGKVVISTVGRDEKVL